MSGIFLGQGGVQRSVRPFVGLGGAWKPIKAAFVGQGGGWKQVYSSAPAAPDPLAAVLDPVTGFWSGSEAGHFAGPFNCTPSGGVPPYSYAWEGGEATNPSGASTYFRSSFWYYQVISCTVVDSTGAQFVVFGDIIP